MIKDILTNQNILADTYLKPISYSKELGLLKELLK